MSSLVASILAQDLDGMRAALGAGASANALDPELQRAPLHIAISPGSPRAPAVVELLVSRGADLNAEDAKTKLTPLMAASIVVDTSGPFAVLELQKSKLIVERLLNLGADPGRATQGGETPLLVAVSAGNIEVLRLLIARGAKPDQADAKGDTPLSRATRLKRQDMSNALLAAGAQPQIAARGGVSVPETAEADTAGADGAATDSSGISGWVIGGLVVAAAVVAAALVLNKKKPAPPPTPAPTPIAVPPIATPVVCAAPLILQNGAGVSTPPVGQIGGARIRDAWLHFVESPYGVRFATFQQLQAAGGAPFRDSPWPRWCPDYLPKAEPAYDVISPGDTAGLYVDLDQGPGQSQTADVQLSSSAPDIVPVPPTAAGIVAGLWCNDEEGTATRYLTDGCPTHRRSSSIRVGALPAGEMSRNVTITATTAAGSRQISFRVVS